MFLEFLYIVEGGGRKPPAIDYFRKNTFVHSNSPTPFLFLVCDVPYFGANPNPRCYIALD